MNLAGADAWIRAHVEPIGAIETTHERSWSTVRRVATADGLVWFKACAEVQAFEPRLTAELGARWPDRVAEVLAHDEERGWLLLVDAGAPIATVDPEPWLGLLPRYAELQRGEAAHAADHVAHGVPDLRVAVLPDRYDDLFRGGLPLEPHEVEDLRALEPTFAELCAELAARGVADSIQHDDLHMWNVYARGDELRVLDWGDSCVSHPFASPWETFRFLEDEVDERWLVRLRDAYLEPWGTGLVGTFELAQRVAGIAHAVAWRRQRDALPQEELADFDVHFGHVLRRALRTARSP